MKRSTIQLVLLGLSVSAGVWLADTVVDTYVFHQGTLWQVFSLAVAPEDGYDRLIAAVSILLFAVVVAISNRKRLQIQDTLNTTLAFNRDLMEKTVAAIFTIDDDGSVVKANVAASTLSGYSGEELTGMDARVLFPQEAWADTLLRPANLHKGKIRASQHVLRRKDGALVPVEIRPRLQKTGHVEALIEDITERAEATAALLASETKYRQLMDHAPNGIFIAELQGKILEVNRRACNLLGYTREELEKLTIPDLMPANELQAGMTSMKRLLAGEIAISERHLVHRDGSLIPVEISSRIIGENIFQSIVRDITERREAEKSLRASDDRFRQLFDSTPSAIVVVDDSGAILHTNRTITEMFGYTPEGLIGKPLNLLLPEHLRSSHDRYFHAFVRHPEPLSMGRDQELRARRQDGSTFPIEVDLSYSSAEGEFLSFAIITDISQRFEHENALRASEERFRSIFEEAPIGISLADEHGRLVSANPALGTMLGYAEQELIGTPFRDFTHPDDRELGNVPVADLREGRIASYSLDKRYVRKDNQVLWVHLSLSRFPGEFSEGPITMALIEDVTERKKAEAALHRANRAYRMISECNQALVRAVDEHEMLNEICGIIVTIGGYRLAWVGIPAENQSGGVLPVAWAGEARQSLDEAISLRESNPAQSALRTGETVITHEAMPRATVSSDASPASNRPASAVALPLILGDQRYGVVEIESFETGAFDDNEVVLLAELASDIAFGMATLRLQTYRRQAERHLMESEALFRAFFDNTAVGTAILSPDGRFVEMNEAVSQMFGYGPRDLIGKHFSILQSGESFERLDLAFEHLIRGGWTDDVFEAQCVRKDGQELWARISVGTITTPRGDIQYVTSITQDISEAKYAEQQLGRLAAELDQRVKERTAELQNAYERLQALGEVKDEFVSNVSHELRTPITSLKLYQALLEKRPEESSTYLARLNRETRRLEVIIEDLLTLSRLEQGRVDILPTPTDLNTFLRDLVADRSVIAETQQIELTCELDPTLPSVEVDASLIGQAVSVLLTNAINYTQEGGHVTVVTSHHKEGDRPGVAITVRDDGPGIRADEQPRLFTRFYRGQAGSKLGVPGTGLGLAIAEEIVSRHSGQIVIFSKGIPGKGSAFTIWLPVRPGFVADS